MVIKLSSEPELPDNLGFNSNQPKESFLESNVDLKNLLDKKINLGIGISESIGIGLTENIGITTSDIKVDQLDITIPPNLVESLATNTEHLIDFNND
jgi:hypothetical protein